MKLTREGEIIVNYIYVVVDEEHVKVWEADLHSKYAGVLLGGAPTNLIHLYRDEHTLKIDDAKAGLLTTLDTELPSDEWIVMTEVPRYTLRIVAYKNKDLGEEEDPVYVYENPAWC